MTAAEVRARLEARVSRPEAVPPLSVVGLLTRDRVERVRRALASFRENARRHGRRPSFVVADNSEALSTQAACREALAALRAADPEPPEIRYVGAARARGVRRSAGSPRNRSRGGPLRTAGRDGLRIRGGREPERAPPRHCGGAVPERRRRRRLRARPVPRARAGNRALLRLRRRLRELQPGRLLVLRRPRRPGAGDPPRRHGRARPARGRAGPRPGRVPLGGRGRAREAGPLRPAPAGPRDRPRRPGASHASGSVRGHRLVRADVAAPPHRSIARALHRQRGRIRERLRVPAGAARRAATDDHRRAVLPVHPAGPRQPRTLAPVHARPALRGRRVPDRPARVLRGRVLRPPPVGGAARQRRGAPLGARGHLADRRVDPDGGAAGPLRPLVHAVPRRRPRGAPARPRCPPRIPGRASGRRLPGLRPRTRRRAEDALPRAPGGAASRARRRPGVLGARPPPACGHRARRARHRCLLRPSRPGGQPSGGRARVAAPRRAGRATLDQAQAIAQRLVRGYGALLRLWPDLASATRELRARGVELGAAVGEG